MMTEQGRVQEIRNRVENTTPGGWKPEDMSEEVLEGYKTFYWTECPNGCQEEECEGHYEERAFYIEGLGHVPKDGDEGWYFTAGDATFIANAREDIGYLLDQIASRDRQKGIPASDREA